MIIVIPEVVYSTEESAAMASGLWNLLCTHKACKLFVEVLWLGVLLNFTCLQVSY